MSPVHDLIARNRNGEAIGLPCFCTANEHVLRAVLAYAKQTGFPTVIEATCNQVNQYGGYTGMTASDFMAWLSGMAAEAGVPMDQLILGGDHLGPNVWKDEPLETAMEKSRELVKSYVQAGFKKIHLDTSMACGGEPNPTFAQIAERAADLCAVAEAHAPNPEELFYIIGTEVPIPGGETEEPDALDVTSVDRFRDTIQTHRDAWAAKGLDAAWSRIVSVVTQPGVDFGHTSIYPFVPEKARPLSDAILDEDGLTFEAHSTDYQSTDALANLVRTHFFFLKVGPELTFRFREAVWALATIEEQLNIDEASNIRSVIGAQMDDNPGYWRNYYSGTDAELSILRTYSYSDRIRYYWTDPKIATALNGLISGLKEHGMPETLVSQAFMGLEFGNMPTDPDALIESHIQRCVGRYFEAAGMTAG
ncbi:D-tagatose-bisphosphate aldolase, class II, non-catalytic subunit [Sulfitobacter noctilucicola]|uniref:D-tagatose-1,6-bisphosphate aldolase subunit GatZ/KbaZ n=1 Tax=Sulfitobacter noctilucicola TaxID=1342301 RepID=A0A7W6MAD7_9RHOB|nr:class II D-tagatose-bisphosphate aldolase, non-catalytic subunit [Sulfitobacter noctilucicola]KIN64230.1 D-tagatose-bisphosphate aldolase, class II, non-catalytic subunit [Sulfitobacter noctilucicola]MBB4174602.1 D-tagatose-1,6-bisphosphate aldolase subunit GatZ/KbaZ [Sulfitobacter noctilucicola]